jgi:hypothetical protein
MCRREQLEISDIHHHTLSVSLSVLGLTPTRYAAATHDAQEIKNR